MNYKTMFLIVIIARVLSVDARHDCLDNSWHLQKEFDNKEYHLVSECLCPCDQITENRNQCIRCSHFHDAQPWVFVSEQSIESKTVKKNQRNDPTLAITTLIKKYSHTHK